MLTATEWSRNMSSTRQTPASAAEFEHRFDQRRAPAAIGRYADVVEHPLGHLVAVEQRCFAAAFDVEIEIDRDQRATRPGRVRRELAIANEIAGDHRIGFRLQHGRDTFVSGWSM